MKFLLEETQRLIRTPAITSEGNEALAHQVSQLFQSRGIRPELQQVTHSMEEVSKRQFNVLGFVGDSLVDRKTKRGFLLTGILDVPPPGQLKRWTKNSKGPSEVEYSEGKLFGHGVVAKADLICRVLAASRFVEKKLKQPLYLAGLCAHDCGMSGARYLIKSGALNPALALIGQPTGMRIVSAQKGLALLKSSIDFQTVDRDARGFNRKIDLTCFGQRAHASTPQYGVDAITRGVQLIELAHQAGFEIRHTRFEGGNSTSLVADRAQFEFFLTSHQFEDFKRFFREAALRLGGAETFQIELGGLGESGIRFLPEDLYPFLVEMITLARQWEQSQGSTGSFDPPGAVAQLTKIVPRVTGVDLYWTLSGVFSAELKNPGKDLTEIWSTAASRFRSFNFKTSDGSQPTPSVDPSKGGEWARLLKGTLENVGIEPQETQISVANELAFFQNAGIDASVWGPGLAQGCSYTAQEQVEMVYLERSIDFYTRLIERVCL